MRVNTKCRGCGSLLVWAVSASGKPVPLDPVAPFDGTIRISKEGVAIVGKKGSGHYMPHPKGCAPVKPKRPTGAGS